MICFVVSNTVTIALVCWVVCFISALVSAIWLAVLGYFNTDFLAKRKRRDVLICSMGNSGGSDFKISEGSLSIREFRLIEFISEHSRTFLAVELIVLDLIYQRIRSVGYNLLGKSVVFLNILSRLGVFWLHKK